MKIYITDILPSILKNKLTKLDTLDIFTKKVIYRNEIVSEDYGIHIIENDIIYRIEPNFNPTISIVKTIFKNELLIDNTDYKMIPVVSQLPVNYILTKNTIYEYQINRKSKLKLIIECLNEPIMPNLFFSQSKQIHTNTNTNIDTDTNIISINFYFVYNDKSIDFSDNFLKEEINVFLSHLN